jgi:protein gp37
MAETSIEWTSGPNGEPGYTFNPVEGCQRVSPGCVNCYAERKNKWLHGGENWGPGSPRLARSDAYWRQPLKWNAEAEKAGQRRKVFCASVADVFEDHPDWVEPRARLFDLIASTRHLDWLLLTKRPQNISEMSPAWGWPPYNVWLGTTVEDQQRANERIPHLVAVPAAVHFLSCEPLLEKVDLCPWLFCEHCGYSKRDQELHGDHHICEARNRGVKVPTGIDWVICGGESGPGARQLNIEWARSLLDSCVSAGVPFFMKQLGARTLMSFDGGDPVGMFFKKAESAALGSMPPGLRVRQFPEARHA